MSLSTSWGTTSAERELCFPCDKLAGDSCNCIFCRGITINAPAPTIYKWLCQMRVAPYSYDWLDNLGRRSPRNLIPGLDELAPNMPLLIVFRIAEFERDRSITLTADNRTRAGRFCMRSCVISYIIVAQSDSRCRLLVKCAADFRGNIFGRAMRRLIPWADLVMMRKQLLNFRALAEKTAAVSGAK
jgi:hypothetical protein